MQSWAQRPGSGIICPLVSWSQVGPWPKVGEAPRNRAEDFKQLPVRPRAGGHHPLEEAEGPQVWPSASPGKGWAPTSGPDVWAPVTNPEHPPPHPSLNTHSQGPSGKCRDSQGLHGLGPLTVTDWLSCRWTRLPAPRPGCPSEHVHPQPASAPFTESKCRGTLVSLPRPRTPIPAGSPGSPLQSPPPANTAHPEGDGGTGGPGRDRHARRCRQVAAGFLIRGHWPTVASSWGIPCPRVPEQSQRRDPEAAAHNDTQRLSRQALRGGRQQPR